MSLDSINSDILKARETKSRIEVVSNPNEPQHNFRILIIKKAEGNYSNALIQKSWRESVSNGVGNNVFIKINGEIYVANILEEVK